jgi:molybdopterin molybdotransferase
MSRPAALPLLRLEEALDQLLAVAKPLAGQQRVPLAEAGGHFAAETLTSPLQLPQTANAAVDGVAFLASALAASAEQPLEICADIRAGHPFDGQVGRGQAARIYTGAVMPEGTDTVVMQEDCHFQDGKVFVSRPVRAGMNCRPAGENLQQGEQILARGARIEAAGLGQLAAAGFAEVPVFAPLTAGLLSTGDELIETGSENLSHGLLYDSNRPMLARLLKNDGLAITDYGIVPDDRTAVRAAFETALAENDLLVVSGGASAGAEDHCRAVMQEIGAEIRLAGLAIKPGRPMSAAVRDGKMLFSLPGNPVAVQVCYRLLVAPLLDRLGGGEVRQPLRVPLPAGFQLAKKSGRAEYLRVKLVSGQSGVLEMRLHGRKGAGVISSLVGADGLVEVPFENDGVKPGMILDFLPFREPLL